jgi:hypothetical protein
MVCRVQQPGTGTVLQYIILEARILQDVSSTGTGTLGQRAMAIGRHSVDALPVGAVLKINGWGVYSTVPGLKPHSDPVKVTGHTLQNVHTTNHQSPITSE